MIIYCIAGALTCLCVCVWVWIEPKSFWNISFYVLREGMQKHENRKKEVILDIESYPLHNRHHHRCHHTNVNAAHELRESLSCAACTNGGVVHAFYIQSCLLALNIAIYLSMLHNVSTNCTVTLLLQYKI